VKHLLALFLSTALFSLTCAADEGMWTLDNFPSRQVNKQYNVDIDQRWLDTVQTSTARLDNGCSGSFVSPDGLVLTNNHCVWGCMRNLSSANENLSELGFVAPSREQERTCPGLRISVLQQMEDITEKVEAATSGKADSEANDARKAQLTSLEKNCEDASNGKLACESVTLYRGGQYFLYKYKRYDDVRLSFAPELPIAAFGGDPDNFNFPRWCLDMAMLRVYEDGKPAASDNYLKWRKSGPDEGEPVFVAGHPGSTQRLMTLSQLEHLRASTLPQRLLMYSELRGRMLAWANTGDEPARIVQQRILGIENGIKVWRNQLSALLDSEQMAFKQQQEEQLREAVNKKRKLRKEYGDAWDNVDTALASYRQFEDRYRFIEAAYGFRGSLFRYARTLVRGTAEIELANTDRLREYRDTALPAVEQQLFAAVPVYSDYEQLQLNFSLEKLREWLGPDDATVKAVLGKESASTLASNLVAGSTLADPDVRRQLWQGGAEAVAASNDPMIALARQIDTEARSLRKRYEDEVKAVLDAASEKIAGARFALGGSDVYPDATFTLRVSYGSVAGWDENGTPVEPFTRVAKLFERTTGQEPFRLPASWQQNGKRLGDNQPFNLSTTNDIIGGNSGSPLIDAQGRVVGLVFDGNIHSIAGAYWFDPAKNRTVAVHSGLMLEAMDKVYGAKMQLDELTVVP
jgi:V8-like Glu-specific endopeptidase